MPSINMIAGRRAEKRRQEQNIRKLIYGLSAEVACAVLAVCGLTIRQVALHGRIDDLGAQIQNLEPKVNKIQSLQDQITALQPKVKTLDGAKADTLFWYSNLYALTSSLPEKTWLTAVTVAGGAPGGTPGGAAGSDPTVSITGVTLNQGMVGEAMSRMNRSPGTDHVDLSFVQQQKTGSVDTVSFQLTAHLKPEPGAAQGGASDVKKS